MLQDSWPYRGMLWSLVAGGAGVLIYVIRVGFGG